MLKLFSKEDATVDPTLRCRRVWFSISRVFFSVHTAAYFKGLNAPQLYIKLCWKCSVVSNPTLPPFPFHFTRTFLIFSPIYQTTNHELLASDSRNRFLISWDCNSSAWYGLASTYNFRFHTPRKSHCHPENNNHPRMNPWTNLKEAHCFCINCLRPCWVTTGKKVALESELSVFHCGRVKPCLVEALRLCEEKGRRIEVFLQQRP